MSLSLDTLKLSGLGPDVFPGTDAAGVLEDSGVRRTYTNGIVKLDDNGGPGGAEQVLGVSLYGVTEDSTGGRPLVLAIDVDGSETTLSLSRWPYQSMNVLATASWDAYSAPAFPVDIELSEANNSGVFGTIRMASAEEDGYISLAVPFSPTKAVISANDASILASVELQGITPENSVNGRLSWSYAVVDGGYEFNVSNGSVVLASGVSPFNSYPDVVSLQEAGGSGVTGTAVLNVPCPAPGASGSLGLRVPKGVQVRGVTEIGGGLEVSGSFEASGDLSVGGDAVVAGTIALKGLPKDGENLPLVVWPAGRVGRDMLNSQRLQVQRAYAADTCAAVTQEGEYLVSLLEEGRDFTIPDEWWEAGKTISIKAVFVWSREIEDDLKMIADLFIDTNGFYFINLFHDYVATTYDAASGECHFEAHLVVDRAEDDEEMLEVRGYYRLNDAYSLIPVLGTPMVGDYRLRIQAGYSGSGYDNLIQLKSVSMTLGEEPSPLSAS